MRMTILIVATMLTVGGGIASASEQSERRASVLRARAAELKMQAEALRDAKENNPARAKQLDAQAESLYQQANEIDDIAWPPRE
jgi:hypothetical protein